jgi:hypothetical protein
VAPARRTVGHGPQPVRRRCPTEGRSRGWGRVGGGGVGEGAGVEGVRRLHRRGGWPPPPAPPPISGERRRAATLDPRVRGDEGGRASRGCGVFSPRRAAPSPDFDTVGKFALGQDRAARGRWKIPPDPPFSKGGERKSPFAKGGFRGISAQTATFPDRIDSGERRRAATLDPRVRGDDDDGHWDDDYGHRDGRKGARMTIGWNRRGGTTRRAAADPSAVAGYRCFCSSAGAVPFFCRVRYRWDARAAPSAPCCRRQAVVAASQHRVGKAEARRGLFRPRLHGAPRSR